jgi:hypothetical protein
VLTYALVNIRLGWQCIKYQSNKTKAEITAKKSFITFAPGYHSKYGTLTFMALPLPLHVQPGTNLIKLFLQINKK